MHTDKVDMFVESFNNRLKTTKLVNCADHDAHVWAVQFNTLGRTVRLCAAGTQEETVDEDFGPNVVSMTRSHKRKYHPQRCLATIARNMPRECVDNTPLPSGYFMSYQRVAFKFVEYTPPVAMYTKGGTVASVALSALPFVTLRAKHLGLRERIKRIDTVQVTELKVGEMVTVWHIGDDEFLAPMLACVAEDGVDIAVSGGWYSVPLTEFNLYLTAS